MTALPDRDIYTNNTVPKPTSAQGSVVMGQMYDYAKGQFGTSGVPSRRAGAENYTLTSSVNANELTVALKRQDGGDPTVADPVRAFFVSGIASATITINPFDINTALSLTLPSGNSCGLRSGKAGYLCVYLLNGGGTGKLGVSAKYHGLEGVVSTIAVSAGGTSKTAMYADAVYANLAFVYLGMILVNETTAGVYATAPSETRIWPHPYPKASAAAYKNAAWLHSSSGAALVYDLNTVVDDVDGNMDTSLDAFVAKVHGFYEFRAQTKDVPAGLAVTTTLALYKNDAVWSIKTYVVNVAGVEQNSSVVAWGGELFPGDKVDVRIYQDRGTSMDFGAGPEYSGFHGQLTSGW